MEIPFKRVHDDLRHFGGDIKDPLAHEIFSTIAHETFGVPGSAEGTMKQFYEAAKERGYFDVKIVIDGKEFNPEFFNRVFDGLDKMIERKALEMACDKVKDALREADILNEIVKDAGANLIDKFNLNTEDYEN